MKAVGYARISEKDQSHNSLDNQSQGIKDYCLNNSIDLVKIFTDNGKSAFTFNRPEWIQLENYIKKNKVQFIVVYHIDRFSRATLMDALIKLHEIEVKLKVKVLTVTDPVNMDSKDLGVQLMRTINLLFSNNERNRIQDRVKDGIYSSMASGRFCNMAPIGYKNAKDNAGKPLIIVDKDKAHYIKRVFTLFNQGFNTEAIRRAIPELKLSGNSAIRRVLTNSLYAGIINLPAYKGKPAREVAALHEPIITKFQYYAALHKLNQRTITVQASENVWLRGAIHCHCGRLMTAGNSKGRSKYYWYYKCPQHKKNHSATVMHNRFKELLDEMSFSDNQVTRISKMLHQAISEHQSKKGGNIMRLKLDLTKTQSKIEETQTRYLLNTDIPITTYSKVMTELKEKEASLEEKINKASTDTKSLVSILQELMPKLNKLSEVFFSMPLYQRQLFIWLVFSRSLVWDGRIYRTVSIDPIFADKALILKEKGLLEIEQSFDRFNNLPASTRDGSIIESYEKIYKVMCC